MTPRMFADLHKAIDKIIDKYCEENEWPELIHESLTIQMAKAAELVFDSCQDAQVFMRREGL